MKRQRDGKAKIVRVHPISLALRYLKGQRGINAAPYRGEPTFGSEKEAIDTLRKFTGQDFGNNAAKWGKWLRSNRWVYFASPGDPRLNSKGG